MMKKDRILNPQIIKGIKPIKNKPTFNSGNFNKKLPIAEHNFPMSKYTTWQIYGYKKDTRTGLKKPFWINKVLPTGRPLTPKLVGLDGFFTVKPINQIT